MAQMMLKRKSHPTLGVDLRVGRKQQQRRGRWSMCAIDNHFWKQKPEEACKWLVCLFKANRGGNDRWMIRVEIQPHLLFTPVAGQHRDDASYVDVYVFAE